MKGREGFVGRSAELAVLDAGWRAPGGSLIVVYGRRRVGKTELLRRFLGRRRGIFHVGKLAPPGLQLRELMEEAARVLDEPLLASVPATDWQTALQQIVDRWKGPGKLVLVLDEFQWTAQASPELPSVLQALWDERWRRAGVMLVLCGSFVGFMEREVLGQKSPLFGRRTAQIHLRPFGWGEASLFHPAWSIEQQAMVYFVCGGVPQYLLAFRPSRSFRQGVEAELLTEFSPLHREPEFLLREELREVDSYHAVLMAIARGATRPRDISNASGLPERSLHYNLEQLVQLGYVARRFPLTGARVPRTEVRFVLEDPLLRFWFRFVFPNESFLAQFGPERTWEARIAPDLDAYFGGCFERLCREALPALLRRERVASSVEVGEYWDKTVQIDVVGVREDRWTELGECKWGRADGPGLRSDLDGKVQSFPNPRNDTLATRAFVRKWRGRRPAGLRLHTLEEIAEAMRPARA